MTEKTNAAKATILLSGEVKSRYDTIRSYMLIRMPGITPKAADVIRHALYLASEVVEDHKENVEQDLAAYEALPTEVPRETANL